LVAGQTLPVRKLCDFIFALAPDPLIYFPPVFPFRDFAFDDKQCSPAAPARSRASVFSRAKTFVANNWQVMLAGAVAGGVARYGVKALFALAATQVALPVAAALPALVISAAVAGMAGGAASSLARAYWRGDRQRGWVKRAVKQGAVGGLVGGALFSAAADFLPLSGIGAFVRDRFSGLATALAPASAHAAELVSTARPIAISDTLRDHVFASVETVSDNSIDAQNLARMPDNIQTMGARALRTGDPRALTHYMKEASFWLINRGHSDSARHLGVQMIETTCAWADQHNVGGINSWMLHRDLAWLRHVGLSPTHIAPSVPAPPSAATLQRYGMNVA
jgi:hypothetical protein